MNQQEETQDTPQAGSPVSADMEERQPQPADENETGAQINAQFVAPGPAQDAAPPAS